MKKLLLLLPLATISCSYSARWGWDPGYVQKVVDVDDYVTEFIAFELGVIAITLIVFGVWIVILLSSIRGELRERNLMDRARAEGDMPTTPTTMGDRQSIEEG